MHTFLKTQASRDAYRRRTPIDFALEIPTIERFLAERPGKSWLLRFVADAPTTTMQRLKGLTTGGLQIEISPRDSTDYIQSMGLESRPRGIWGR